MTKKISYKEMQKTLMDELRLLHYPIAVKFIFKDEELKDFIDNASFYEPVRSITFCQFETAARMKKQTVLGTRETMGCSNALYNFGWKAFDDAEVRAHLKYAKDWDQAVRFIRTKPRLPEGALKAFIVSPLADTYFPPDSVHFYCDNMQAYHLAVDYMSAMDIHPLRSNQTVSSSACGGNVYTFLEKSANIITACGGSFTAGKTERGEINVIIPGEHIQATVQRLLDRIQTLGSASLAKPGDPYPGADICKNCNLINFRKKKEPGKDSTAGNLK
jgi:uncharacterized protein (DUF169 family)